MPKEPSEQKLEQRAKNILLHQLSRSMKSKKQLRDVLEKREIPEDIAAAVIDRFEEAQLIDDREFARAFVASRLSMGGKSRSAIARELRLKGISETHAAEALEHLDSDLELELATNLAQKRFRQLSGLEREVRYRRLTGFLARRGFSSAVIGTVMRHLD